MPALHTLRIVHWTLSALFLALGAGLLFAIDRAVREVHEMGRGGAGTDAFADDMMLLAAALFLVGLAHGVSAELAAAGRARLWLTSVGLFALAVESYAGMRAYSEVPATFQLAAAWGAPFLGFCLLGPMLGLLTLRACWMAEPTISIFAAGGVTAWMAGGSPEGEAAQPDEGYEEEAPPVPAPRRRAPPRQLAAPPAYEDEGDELDGDGATSIVPPRAGRPPGRR